MHQGRAAGTCALRDLAVTLVRYSRVGLLTDSNLIT